MNTTYYDRTELIFVMATISLLILLIYLFLQPHIIMKVVAVILSVCLALAAASSNPWGYRKSSSAWGWGM